MLRNMTIVVLALLACGTQAAEQLPLESFASLPDVQHISLSPDGKLLASSIRVDVGDIKGRAVSIVDLETGEQTLPLMAKTDTYFIYWTRWASDTHLLVGAMYPDIRYGDYGSGKRDTRETTLMVVNAKTGDVHPAVSRRFLSRFEIKPAYRDRVIDILPEDDDHILMAMTGDTSGVIGMRRYLRPLVYKVNLEDQTVRTVQRPLANVYNWMTDRQHRVRVALAHKDTVFEVMIRDIEKNKWRTLWEFPLFSEQEVWPLGFDSDPNTLYVKAYHDGRFAVFRVDLQDPALQKELVYADPDYDVEGSLIYSRRKNQVIGISYARHGGYVFWDEEYKTFQAAINKALPNTKNFVYGVSTDESKYVVLSSSDTESGTYYIGDRKKGSLKVAAFRYKHLPPKLMAAKQPYSYKARDGLDIEAYLTLPKGYDDKSRLPALVFPHGGPISETTDGFSYWAQLFANRGYAVLQMNFRGSSGRGFAFMEAGLANWGKEMQDDVQDGAKQLIADGIADPDRICIVGASYGGYAALMGAVKTPDFYRCAASFAGVSDVERLVEKHRSRYAKKNIVDLQIGEDDKALRQVSPINRADEIEVPVLLVHGTADRQVPPEHSEKMHTALKDAGKDVTYLELPGGNHYLTNNEDRITTLRTVDKFLAKHLRPDAEPEITADQ